MKEKFSEAIVKLAESFGGTKEEHTGGIKFAYEDGYVLVYPAGHTQKTFAIEMRRREGEKVHTLTRLFAYTSEEDFEARAVVTAIIASRLVSINDPDTWGMASREADVRATVIFRTSIPDMQVSINAGDTLEVEAQIRRALEIEKPFHFIS